MSKERAGNAWLRCVVRQAGASEEAGADDEGGGREEGRIPLNQRKTRLGAREVRRAGSAGGKKEVEADGDPVSACQERCHQNVHTLRPKFNMSFRESTFRPPEQQQPLFKNHSPMGAIWSGHIRQALSVVADYLYSAA